MSDTPRTDAAVFFYEAGNGQTAVVPANVARELERESNLAEAKLNYLRSQSAGLMGEKLYKLEKELAELREELRLRHEADVKASAYAKQDISPQVSHTNGDK
jgi:hypothetical protein